MNEKNLLIESDLENNEDEQCLGRSVNKSNYMEFNRIIDQIHMNINANQPIRTDIQNVLQKTYIDPVEFFFYLLKTTPKFSHQALIVDEIIAVVDSKLQRKLADYIIDNFKLVDEDQRDKYFLFIERSWSLYSFKELLSFENEDVLDAAARHINKNIPSDWDDDTFLKFLCTCKPWIATRFKDIKIRKEKVKNYLKKIEINKENKNALFSLIRDEINS